MYAYQSKIDWIMSTFVYSKCLVLVHKPVTAMQTCVLLFQLDVIDKTCGWVATKYYKESFAFSH